MQRSLKARSQPTLAESAFGWFLRIVAAYSLLSGVLYWSRLIGIEDGPLNRFDLMPIHWQVTTTSLAVLFPFAASGLWMRASWGPVIWFLGAAIETAMYGVLTDLFGARPLLVASHALVVLLYLSFRLVIYLQNRERA
jgi:hypothetical protein